MFGTQIFFSTLVYILVFVALGIISLILSIFCRGSEDRNYYTKHLYVFFSALVYNLVEGLLPDEKFPVNILSQNIVAFTVGLCVALHFFLFLKKEYDLIFLKRIGFYKVAMSSLLGLVVLFILPYTITESLGTSRSLFLLFSLLFLLPTTVVVIRGQFQKFKKAHKLLLKIHAINGGIGFLSLVSLPLTVFVLGDDQLVEHTFFSFGFFFIAVDFLLYGSRKLELKEMFRFESLSVREKEILAILLEDPDLRYSQISSRLNISSKTVSAHLSSIYKKVGIKNKKEIQDMSDHLRKLLI